METKKIVLFFGHPGSGKSTQRKMLQKYLAKSTSALSIDIGSTIREKLKKSEGKTFVKILKDEMNRGNLLPSSIPVWCWTDKLFENFSGQEYIIVDGGGRKPIEAKLLLEFLMVFEKKEVHVINLQLTLEESIARLTKRNRSDDVEEAFRNRAKIFEDEKEGTVGSIKFLSENNLAKVHNLDATGTDEEVFNRIKETLLI